MICRVIHLIGLTEQQIKNSFSQYTKKDHELLLNQLNTIIDSGHLLSGSCANRISNSFSIDYYVNDDKYVFLSLGDYYLRMYGEYAYGLVFDARQLILEVNAVIGKKDLFTDYSNILLETIESIYNITPKDCMYEFIPSPSIKPAKIRRMPLKQQYLYNAFMANDEAFPGVRELKSEFRRSVVELHKEKRLCGEEAICYINDWLQQPHYTNSFPELLVPGKLPIQYAIGKIIAGKMFAYP